MDLDVATTDRLVKSVVVNNDLTAVLVPYLDAESIIATWVKIFSPDNELE